MAKKMLCNMCGDEFDNSLGTLSIQTTLGYGSAFDGDELNVDFCGKCTDKIIRGLKEKCVIAPLIEY